jgi:hypothetical protein
MELHHNNPMNSKSKCNMENSIQKVILMLKIKPKMINLPLKMNRIYNIFAILNIKMDTTF